MDVCVGHISYTVFGSYCVDQLSQVFTSVMCILWAPETLGKTLEDIDGVWEERMRKTKHLLHLGGGSEGPNILNDEQRNESSGLELTDRV